MCDYDDIRSSLCRRSCNACSTENGENLGSACFDRGAANRCRYWRKLGYCSKSIIRNTVCRKSCGSCGGDIEDQDVDPEDEVVPEEEKNEDIQEEVPCTDQTGEYRCMLWKNLGFCTHDKMRNTYCRKSCGACELGKLRPLTTCLSDLSSWMFVFIDMIRSCEKEQSLSRSTHNSL